VQGSREIARALEHLCPRPPLLPADPALRRQVEEAEGWGERELQSVPRRILRWGLVHNNDLRRWLADQTGLPLPAVAARTTGPTARYYARLVGADEAAARRDVESLPAMLAHVDGLLGDGVITVEPPNVATLQVLATVRSLYGFTDFRDHVATHPCADAALQVFPDFPGPVPPFVPPQWLTALHAG
jgi:glutathione S-transferase